MLLCRFNRFVHLLSSSSPGYYIRPAQPVGADKRFLADHYERISYYYIKALKTILELDVNSYLLKKVLMKPSFRMVKFGTHRDGRSFFKMLSQPELKRKFESRIDYNQWAGCSDFEMGFIPLIPRGST